MYNEEAAMVEVMVCNGADGKPSHLFACTTVVVDPSSLGKDG